MPQENIWSDAVRQALEIDDDMRGDCAVCGEAYDVRSTLSSVSDIGEFVNENGEHGICHAECGINAGFDLA